MNTYEIAYGDPLLGTTQIATVQADSFEAGTGEATFSVELERMAYFYRVQAVRQITPASTQRDGIATSGSSLRRTA